MSAGYFFQQLVNATQVSAIYSLLAVSYVLMHAITQRINFAFGALAVWAGYTIINTTLALRLALPGWVLLPLIAGGCIALAHTVLTGATIVRCVIRPLLPQRSLATLVATLGLAIALEETMRLANDSRERWLPPVSAAAVRIGGSADFDIQITSVQVVVVLIAALFATGLAAVMARHPFGRAWRACAQDLGMAELCGVDAGRTLAITFLIASLAAATAGILLATSYGVATYHGGLVIGLKTLFVAVVGGFGSLAGALIGGLILGLFETLWSGYLGPDYRDAAAFLALSGLMILFPNGLLAPSDRVDHV